MELSAADTWLDSLGSGKLGQTDLQLNDILRRRQRPLLLLIDKNGELVYSTALPDGNEGARTQAPLTQRLIAEALIEARRPFRDAQAAVVPRLAIDKPGERCALVTLGNQLFCLRLFALQNANGVYGELYAALVEGIGRPQTDTMDSDKIKALFRLSKREMDVLGALMSGDTDKEIAQKLAVSVETVRAYLKSIRAKLRAKTRTAIVSIIHAVQTERPNRGA